MIRSLVSPSLVLVTAVVLGGRGPAAAQSQPDLAGYGVLALDSVRLAPGARVQPGAVGATAGTVRLSTAAAAPGSVVAESVRLGRRARVGRLFCRLVSGRGFGPGVVGGPTVGGSPNSGCRALTVPLVDPALLAPVAVAPGSADLAVPPRSGSEPVGAGAFGAVTVGRGGLLQLAGGAYQVRSIRLARSARLVCLDDCRIGVAEGVRLGARAQLGAAAGLIRPNRVRVDIAGATGRFAFWTGRRAIVAATIFAPAGAVVLGADGEYRGAYIGRSVVLQPRSRVREDSAFSSPAR